MSIETRPIVETILGAENVEAFYLANPTIGPIVEDRQAFIAQLSRFASDPKGGVGVVEPRKRKKAKKGRNEVARIKPAFPSEMELLHTARTLALCTMPYERPKESEIVRKVSIDGATIYVRFSTYDKSIPLPFGKDRALLTWIMSKALERDSPRVSWGSATEFLAAFQITKGGRQLADLREAMSRICNVVIGFGIMYGSEDPEPSRDRGSKVIYEWSMPSRHELDAERFGDSRAGSDSYFVEVEPKTFEMLKESPISLPSKTLKKHMNSPLAWDFINFLGYQVSRTPKGSMKAIPLRQIMTFLGTDDSNLPRVRAKFSQVLDDLEGFLGDVRVEGRGSSAFLLLEGQGGTLNSAAARPTIGGASTSFKETLAEVPPQQESPTTNIKP